jgi:hypothetical protein
MQNIFVSYLGLVLTPFQNRTGKTKAKLLLDYAFLAIKSNSYAAIKLPELTLRSDVWRNYNKFLLFQLKYIKIKYWAKTPLMLQVTGSYASKHITVSRDQKFVVSEELQKVSEKYSKTFSGFGQKDFEAWLNSYSALMNFFEENTPEGLPLVSNISEIGPGFFPIGSLVLSQTNLQYTSYDTFEMQLLQSRIANEILGKTSKLSFVPTNLANRNPYLSTPSGDYCVYAFWSFTEVEIEEREQFRNLFRFAKYSIIISNSIFEGTDNFKYLKSFGEEMNKTVVSVALNNVLGDEIPKYLRSHKIFLLK